MRALQDIALADPDAERVRRDHAEAIREEQRARPVVVANVELEDGVATVVSHGLGRIPRAILASVPRGAAGAGYIVEERDGIDRRRAFKLTANSYGATITVDLVLL